LKPLYREMRERDLSRCRFSYRRGRVNFDVFFFIDETPFSLLFGARAHNLAFEMAVREGFAVDTRIAPEQYKLLCKALDLQFDPANPFSPRAFLVDFGAALPAALPPDTEPHPHELAIYRPTVDRRDGTYFCGWRDNSVRNEHVSEDNLNKTRALLGFKAYEVCRRKNISSCWSPDPARALKVVIPA
jgi:Family of unknown function (DUF6037)